MTWRRKAPAYISYEVSDHVSRVFRRIMAKVVVMTLIGLIVVKPMDEVVL